MRKRPRFGDADLGTRTALIATTVGFFITFSVIGFLVCLLLGVTGWKRLPVILAFGLQAIGIIRFAQRFANGVAQLVARFVAPSGSTTPYEQTFSYQQSLAARGDIPGALESYEAVLRESPHEAEAHVQAAELYASIGNTGRAIELLRAVREIPGVSSAREIYASNRLIDLYLGAANDDGRALVELRRLVERHPGTDTATRAREALGRLKAQRSA